MKLGGHSKDTVLPNLVVPWQIYESGTCVSAPQCIYKVQGRMCGTSLCYCAASEPYLLKHESVYYLSWTCQFWMKGTVLSSYGNSYYRCVKVPVIDYMKEQFDCRIVSSTHGDVTWALVDLWEMYPVHGRKVNVRSWPHALDEVGRMRIRQSLAEFQQLKSKAGRYCVIPVFLAS
jgi:hypothetical protein